MVLLGALTSCGDLPDTVAPAPDDSAQVEAWPVETWVCHVPAATSSPWYAGLAARRDITASVLAERVARRVPAYFREVSGGRLALDVSTGGEVTLGVSDGAEECVDMVVGRAASSTRLVVVVADAEHVEGRPGGLGGVMARESSAPVGISGVGYAYVGAADLAPSWGDDPPMDLVEHEIGHALGWHHSGTTDDAYDSALDLMSDSAAPRAIDPSRRDAPWPLAVDLLASGWLTPDELLVVDPVVGGSTSTTLQVLTSANDGRRLIVIPVPGRDDVVITVERRAPIGADDHLPVAGLAVHRVEFVPRLGADAAPAPTTDGGTTPHTFDGSGVRRIVPLTGSAPFTDLVEPGESLESDGWRITADADGVVTVGLVSTP